MPKANKLISSRKCQRCRHDKQKCLPEGRQWPGRRCDRCIRYDYVCSANRTRSEEQSVGNGADSLPTQAQLSAPVFPASVPQLLQEMGDLRQIEKIDHLGWINIPNWAWTESNDERLDGVVVMLRLRAEQFLRDGNHKDAEYLYTQILGSKELAESEGWAKKEIDILRDLVSLYEQMSNFPAAEAIQEDCLRGADESDDCDVDDESEKLYRLYGLFYDRIRDIIIQIDGHPDDGAATALLLVFCRVAALGVDPFSRIIATGRRIGVPQSALQIAVVAGATNLIDLLLENGACDIRTTNVYGYTALHLAVSYGRPRIVRQLLEAGADVNAMDRDGTTALMQASHFGDVEMVQLLIASGADVGARDPFGKTALHLALERPAGMDKEVVSALVQAQIDMEVKDVYGRSALGVAQELGDLAVMRQLLEHGADVEADIEGETPLFLAVRQRLEAAVTLLLEKGANVDVMNNKEETPLIVAVSTGHTSIVESLLEYGADIWARNNKGETPLYIAVYQSKDWILQTLIHRGAHVEGRSKSGRTPLYVAVAGAHGAMVKVLLDGGANVSTKFQAGNGQVDPLLHCAIRKSSLAIVEMLLDSAPHAIFLVDLKGNTPIHQVVLEGHEPHERILNFLLERFHHKTEIFAALNENGNTTLHLAALLKRWKMVKMLLIAQSTEGARVNMYIRNDKGEQVLELVRSLIVHETDSNFQAYMEVRRLVDNLAINL